MRYARQAMLKQTGNCEKEMKEKAVVVIGLGGIGCLSADLLARFGIGHIILVDKDVVALTDLHRQILFNEEDIGKKKTDVVLEKLKKTNSEINIKAIEMDVNNLNIEKISAADIILDCTDNLKTKQAINEYSKKTNTPWIFAAALGIKGMVYSIIPGKTKKGFEKIFDHKQSKGCTETDGILNTACNAVACIQVTEAIKFLTGKEKTPDLIVIDIWNGKIEKIKI